MLSSQGAAMFDLGMQEILIVLVVALVFIGPRKLPEIAKTLGRAFIELRRAGEELKGQIDLATIMEEPEPPKAPAQGGQAEAEQVDPGPSQSPSHSSEQVEELKAPDEAQAEAPQKTQA
ncbi:MAG: twin-arginine translocase TatA/TatE family subunit [bacterium]